MLTFESFILLSGKFISHFSIDLCSFIEIVSNTTQLAYRSEYRSFEFIDEVIELISVEHWFRLLGFYNELYFAKIVLLKEEKYLDIIRILSQSILRPNYFENIRIIPIFVNDLIVHTFYLGLFSSVSTSEEITHGKTQQIGNIIVGLQTLNRGGTILGNPKQAMYNFIQIDYNI